MQFELKRVGCFGGNVDGELSSATRDAMRDFAKYASISLPQDGLSPDALKAIREFDKRVCPLVCPSGEHPEGDRCTPHQLRIGRGHAGRCLCRQARVGRSRRRSAGSEAEPHPHAQRPAAAAPRGGGKCFAFQGRQFCE